MVNMIHISLPDKATTIRIHVSGDFFNQAYFDAWMIVARFNPNVHFYAYTKSVNYWVAYLDAGYKIPTNVNLTASYGGRHDDLINKHNLKSVEVVFHPQQALTMGLEIDHDDSLAKHGRENFAILLHGVQPAKSEASKALSKMRQENISFSYGKGS